MRPEVLLGAAVLLVAAGVIGAATTGDGSDQSDPAPKQAARGDFRVAPGDGAGTGSKENDPAPVGEQSAGAGPGAGDEQGDGEQDAGTPAGEGPSDGGVQQPSCPPGLSDEECVALGEAYEDAQGQSHHVKDGECPPGLTPEDCAALGEAYAEAKE